MRTSLLVTRSEKKYIYTYVLGIWVPFYEKKKKANETENPILLNVFTVFIHWPSGLLSLLFLTTSCSPFIFLTQRAWNTLCEGDRIQYPFLFLESAFWIFFSFSLPRWINFIIKMLHPEYEIWNYFVFSNLSIRYVRVLIYFSINLICVHAALNNLY